MKKTKIVCTVGPTSCKRDVLAGMFKNGMNVARLNFSHGRHEDHAQSIELIKGIRKSENAPLAIMLDTKGPEIRIKTLRGGSVLLEKGQIFTLTGDDTLGDNHRVALTYRGLYKEVQENDTIALDDGRIILRVCEIVRSNIVCNVEVGGELKDQKGVNVPHVKLDMEYISEQDKKDILFGILNDIDYIAASFARRRNDMEVLRAFLDENGGSKIKIIAKIENMEGVENFEEILELVDGVMIARGDMGVEIEYEKLPGIQKQLIKRANHSGKICITATQMLESMIINMAPTRAEITDVANAVYDGTSAIMLSGETAMGKHPVEAVKAMSTIAVQAERDRIKLSNMFIPSKTDIGYGQAQNNITDAVGHAACSLAYDIAAKAIIAITKSGYTANMMSKFRPPVKIIAATPYEKVFHQLSLVWGAYPVIMNSKDNLEDLLETSMQTCLDSHLINQGDQVVLSAGLPINVSGTTNMIRVETA